jgi:esterase/lipase superfamily enzyme
MTLTQICRKYATPLSQRASGGGNYVVLARILLFLIAVSAAVGTGHSQSADTPGVPEPCRTQRSEDLAALEKRKVALEKGKRRLERAIARAKKKPGTEDEAKAKEKDNARRLSRTQRDLLKVLFQIDCVKAKQTLAKAEAPVDSVSSPPRQAPAPSPQWAPAPQAAPPPPGLRAKPRSLRKARGEAASAPQTVGTAGTASAGTGEDSLEVTTYFATNRERTAEREPVKAYNAKVAKLTYGRAVVSIPAAHTAGSLELPSIWRLEFRADPKRHFILKDAVSLDADDARAEMTKRLQGAKSKSLLVFVHGYNMSFAETAMRTAQLAYDLNFPGIPFFFSWPSAAQYTSYLRDAETAQLSEGAFDQVLDDLSRLPVDDVYIIAHSMGSRVVSQVLKSRVDRGKTTTKISDLLLAAPDINADLFRTVIAPRLKALEGTLTTVYASSSDLALLASKAVHGYARVGETAGGVFVFPGLDTVDASRATMAVRAFGHSYLTDSAAVLKDIAAIVRQKLSAKQRGLAQLGASPNIYWSLPERR